MAANGSHEGKAIVVGYSTREPIDRVMDEAIREARLRKAHLVVVHAMKGGRESESDNREILETRKALDAVEMRLTNEGITHRVGLHVRGLSPAEDLAQTVVEEEASLLVIGCRRRTRTSKLLLGSDTQSILLASPCPVLAVA